RPLPSTDNASARSVPLTRTTPAPNPGRFSVLVRTMWSYCRYTQRLLAMVGEASSARRVLLLGAIDAPDEGEAPDDGDATDAGRTANASRSSVCTSATY